MAIGKDGTMKNEKSEFVKVDDSFMERFNKVPGLIEGQESRDAARVEMDCVYAASLGAIRNAAKLTQDDIAKKMGIQQSAVSRLEAQNDMLLSTFLGYLTATGAENAAISVTVRGQRIDYDLATLNQAHRETQKT